MTRQERIDYLYKLLDEATGQLTACQHAVVRCNTLKTDQDTMVATLKDSVRCLHEMMKKAMELKLNDEELDLAEMLLKTSITASNMTFAKIVGLEVEEAKRLMKRQGPLN